MIDTELHTRAIIAAALIQSRTYDMAMIHAAKTNPKESAVLSKLLDAVDTIYTGLQTSR